jgi:hypothetical protein
MKTSFTFSVLLNILSKIKIATFVVMTFVLLLGKGMEVEGQTVTVPAANTNTGSVNDPFGTYWGYERTALIYTAAQIGATGTINSVGFYLNSVSSAGQATNVRIYMKTRTTLMTANTTYATEISGATLVYGPTSIPAASFVAGGWFTVNLATPFSYTGNNLEIIIETNSTGGGNEYSGTAKQFRYSSPGSIQYYQNWNSDNTAPTVTGTRSANRPNVQLTFASATCSGTPSAGTASITSATGCASNSFTLNTSGLSSGTGISYLWESSPNSSTWSSTGVTIASYTTSTATTMYYRLKTTCSGSGLVNYTNVVSYTTVSGNPATLNMIDSYGDGWNGGSVTITSAGGISYGPYTISSGTSGTQALCIPSDCYSISVATGSYPGEMTWSITNGATTYTSGNGYSGTMANAFSIGISSCEMTVPSSGNNSYTVCSGNLYDHGGSAGGYAISVDGYTVLYPATAGTMMSISGTSAGETCCDYIQVYNGVGTSGTLLWSGYAGIGTIPTITSTDASGALTVRFYSDSSVTGAGFSIAMSCYTPQVCSTCPNYNYGIYTPTITPATHSASTAEAAGCQWYAFNVSLGSEYVFSTCSNGGAYSGNSKMWLYDNSCSAITSVDNYCSFGPQITWTATYTGVVYLQMAHYSFSSAVSWTLAYWKTPPPGENCSNAQNLATLTSPYSSTTTGYADDISTCRTGYPDHIFYIDVANGYSVNIGQSSNTFDSYHYMGYGGSCPGTTQIVCMDDSDTQVNSWTNTTGSTQTVYFVVDGFSGSGDFVLEWSVVAPPPATPGTPISNSPNCNNVTISANGSAPVGEVWYWQISATGTSTANSGATYVVTASGTYYLRSYRSSDAVWGTAASISVVINSEPTTVSAGSDVTICNGTSTQLTGSAMASSTSTIGVASGTDLVYPYNTFWHDARSQYVLLASELTNSGMTAGYITSIAFNINSASSQVMNGLNISLKNTSTSTLSGWETGLTAVYSGNYTVPGTGWQAITFQTPFYWDGTSNLLYQFCFDNTSYTTYSMIDYRITATSQMIYTFADGSTGCDMTGFSNENKIPIVRFNYHPAPTFSWTPTATLNSSNIPDPIATPSSTTTYTMTATANGCSVSDDVIVTVRPNFTTGAINTSGETICSGGNPAIIGSSTAASGGDNSITYEWRADETAIGSTNSATYDPPTGLTSTTVYTRWAHEGTCNTDWTQSTGTWTVTVRPNFTAGAINTSGETICSGGNPAIIGSSTAASGGDNSITYEWRTGGVAIPGANSETYDPASGIISTTTFTRWAHDNTCNTSWAQATGSYTITVQTPPQPTGLASGDYFWTGAISDSWNSNENWLYFNGTSYSLASAIPDANSNVFIQSYSGTCATTHAVTNASSVVYANDVNIASGLSLGGLSNLQVNGDWNNSGTFISGTGTVAFVGSTVQTIIVGASNFYNLVFANTTATNSDIVIAGDITINGNLTLSSGILNANGHTVNFGSAATVTENSSSSFVHGKMIRTGATAFKFPCGDVINRDMDGDEIAETHNVYTPFEVNPESLATVEVEYFYDNTGMPDWWEHGGNMDATLHHVSDREHWIVNSDQSLINTKIYWVDNAHVDGGFCVHGFDDGISSEFATSDLAVTYWSSTLWRNAVGNVDGNHDSGSITSSYIPFGFKAPTVITFGSKQNLNPLPVELIAYEAKCDGESAELNWSTASEVNNDYFVLQRSTDAQNFTEIVRIMGHGNSNVINNYSYKVTKQEIGTVYYRLVQYDYDGASEILGVVQSDCNNNAESVASVDVSPNPFRDYVNINLNNFNTDSKVVYEIVDQYGRVLVTEEITSTSLKTIFLQNLKPGLYMLRVIDGQMIYINKIIKN